MLDNEAVPLEARVAEDEDFAALKTLLAAESGWTLEYERAGVRVWTEAAANQSALRTVKVVAEFPDVTPHTLYDVLHDPAYRTKWDAHMLEAEDAGYINVNNDVGYYAMTCPAPLKNRDFVLQRSWLDTGREKMILNHSVYHKDFPPRKGFVRAISVLTGFVVRSLPDADRAGGSWLGYVSRSDPRGALPAWLVNRAAAQLAPRLVRQLHLAAQMYPDWKSWSADPEHKPWLYPDQVPSHRISVLDCVNPEESRSPIRKFKVASNSSKIEVRSELQALSTENLDDFSSEFSLEVELDHAETTDVGEASKKKGKFYKLVKGMKNRRKSIMEKMDRGKHSSNFELDTFDLEKNRSNLDLRANKDEKEDRHSSLDREDRSEKDKKDGFKFHRRFSRSRKGE